MATIEQPTLPPVTLMTAVSPNGNPIASPQIEKLRLRLMAAFGLDTPAEIEQYMQTPAGIEAVNMVVEQIELQETYQKQHELDRRDDQIRHNRMLAFLLLSLLHREAKAKERLREAYQEIEKIIKSGEEHLINESKQFTDQASSMYDSAAKVLEKQLDMYNKEAEQLEKDQESLAKDVAALEDKYQVIDRHMGEGLKLIESDGDKPDALNKHVHELNEKIEKLTNKIAKKVDDNEDPTKQIHRLNALALKRAMLRSFIEDNLYTTEGELLQGVAKRDRYHEAAFCLKPDLQLVKHEGEFMVLGKGENAKDLSQEKREQAVKTFKTHQLQYCEVSKLCASNKAAEHGLLSTRAEKLAGRVEQLNNRMLLLTHQLVALEENKTQVNQLKQTQQTRPTIQQATAPTPKPNSAQVTQTYRHILKLMGNQTPEPAKLMTIAQGMANSKNTDEQLRTLFVQRLEQSGLVKHSDKDSLHQQLLSGGQIQPQTVRELQERINQRPETANTLQERFHPNPFSMTPLK
jgi:uncharacterized protein YoxC